MGDHSIAAPERSRINFALGPGARRGKALRPSRPRQRLKSRAPIQVLRASMGRIDLELDRRAAGSRGQITGRSEQSSTQPLAATLWNDVQLIEPCHQPAVLERPGISQRCQADPFIAVEREEQRAAIGHFDQPCDGSLEALGRDRNGMFFELRLEQTNSCCALLDTDPLDS